MCVVENNGLRVSEFRTSNKQPTNLVALYASDKAVNAFQSSFDLWRTRIANTSSTAGRSLVIPKTTKTSGERYLIPSITLTCSENFSSKSDRRLTFVSAGVLSGGQSGEVV